MPVLPKVSCRPGVVIAIASLACTFFVLIRSPDCTILVFWAAEALFLLAVFSTLPKYWTQKSFLLMLAVGIAILPFCVDDKIHILNAQERYGRNVCSEVQSADCEQEEEEEKNVSLYRRKNTIKVCFDLESWGVTYYMSIYIHEVKGAYGEAHMKIKLPSECSMLKQLEKSECVSLEKLDKDVLLVTASPALGSSGDRYIQLQMFAPAPNQGKTFRRSEMELPKIVEANFATEPFAVEYLGTYNGGLTWGELGE